MRVLKGQPSRNQGTGSGDVSEELADEQDVRNEDTKAAWSSWNSAHWKDCVVGPELP